MSANFCTNCGQRLQPDFLFCTNCGTEVERLIDQGNVTAQEQNTASPSQGNSPTSVIQQPQHSSASPSQGNSPTSVVQQPQHSSASPSQGNSPTSVVQQPQHSSASPIVSRQSNISASFPVTGARSFSQSLKTNLFHQDVHQHPYSILASTMLGPHCWACGYKVERTQENSLCVSCGSNVLFALSPHFLEYVNPPLVSDPVPRICPSCANKIYNDRRCPVCSYVFPKYRSDFSANTAQYEQVGTPNQQFDPILDNPSDHDLLLSEGNANPKLFDLTGVSVFAFTLLVSLASFMGALFFLDYIPVETSFTSIALISSVALLLFGSLFVFSNFLFYYYKVSIQYIFSPFEIAGVLIFGFFGLIQPTGHTIFPLPSRGKQDVFASAKVYTILSITLLATTALFLIFGLFPSESIFSSLTLFSASCSVFLLFSLLPVSPSAPGQIIKEWKTPLWILLFAVNVLLFCVSFWILYSLS